ncbi:restriction endonuclease subunit S [uncultured Alteromonas sp.]|mgnify:CR=1 FL=1|uniref:restriction endonuclease subunit S n=1 Tax=uncultured Alteromonas sp. TaxID=179113 RepID=UPI0030D2876D|tara:strand:+ start:8194 stop:9417 length:1224 start_codon:yes stop_codon:yes gene_type:complete
MSWSVKSIDDITEVVTKGTTPSTYGMPFTDEGINFVKAEALNGDVTLDRSGFTFIDDETHEKLKRSKLHQDDVLVTIAGANVGKCGYVRPSDVPANTNQAVGIVRVKKEEANPRYIYYHFKNPSTFAMCQGIGGGQAAQPNINLTMLKGFKVNMPDLENQNRIVGVIGAYDDLIENNKRRIELLEESARQLYKEWFVRFRFPGHEHVKIINGVPEGWQAGIISDFYQTSSGGTPSRKVLEYYGGDINWVKTQELNNGFIFETSEKITSEAIAKSSAKLFPERAVLVAMYGATIGELGILAAESASNQACCALIAKTELAHYIHAYLFLLENKSGLIGRSKGAAQNNISQDIIKNYDMVMPSSLLMEQFIDYVDPIFSQIKFLTLEDQKLTKARDLLLPKLMNGEVAV